MANCHNLFIDFREELAISSKKESSMMTSRKRLRERIEDHFRVNYPDYTPYFYIQGSYKMRTAIRTKDDECDLDDGVYISPNPNVSSATLQNWVFDAVDGTTDATPMRKNKCVRVEYKANYNIDFPVYYKEDINDKDETPHLAVRSGGYQLSDPRGVVNWFKSKKADNPQLVQIVKYLKAWCDKVRDKMPAGLSMCILAVNNQRKNDRDDIALRDTLKAIKSALDRNFSCIVPSQPFDDMFDGYDGDRKRNFLENLQKFIDDADKAIEEVNQLKASRLWRKHLGERFPLGEDKDDESLKALSALSGTILGGSVRTSRAGDIQTESGVGHLPHTNFGG